MSQETKLAKGSIGSSTETASLRGESPSCSLVGSISRLIASSGESIWIRLEQSIERTWPDLLLISCRPEFSVAAELTADDASILSVMRSSGRVRPVTIAKKVRRSEDAVRRRLKHLCGLGLVRASSATTFVLADEWKNVLREVVSVEFETEAWQPALRRAASNRTFSHRSFVALPRALANDASASEAFEVLGIGLIGYEVTEDASILKAATRSQPFAWKSYFQLAILTASRAVNSDSSVPPVDSVLWTQGTGASCS